MEPRITNVITVVSLAIHYRRFSAAALKRHVAVGTGVLFCCFFCFVMVLSVYSKFWLCDYCNREMKSVSAICFMTKLMAMKLV